MTALYYSVVIVRFIFYIEIIFQNVLTWILLILK
jgi:hypothetical protein